ncbi:MAG: porin [bacterium]
MNSRILFILIVVFIINSFLLGQENKPKVTLYGDFKGYYQTDMTKNTEEFTLNAARIGAKGSLNEFISYKVLVNFAQLGSLSTKKDSDGKVTDVKAKFGEVLQDALFKLNLDKSFYITMGQFKVPISTDNLRTPLEIYFVNRPLLTKVTPELRDVGASATFINNEMIPIEINAGLFNGSGANKTETDRTLNYAFRGLFKPIEQVSLSGNYYSGKLTNTDVNIFDFGTTVKVNNLQVDAEYAYRDADSTNFTRKSFSFYGYALYTFKMDTKLISGIQPSIRYEYFEPDNNIADDEQNRFTVGLSLILIENSLNQIKFNYEILDYKNINKDTVKKFYIAFQTAF